MASSSRAERSSIQLRRATARCRVSRLASRPAVATPPAAAARMSPMAARTPSTKTVMAATTLVTLKSASKVLSR